MTESLRTSCRRGTVFEDVRLLAALLAVLPVGHSVEGRALRPVVLGSLAAPHRVLVVGCIHGTETAGVAVTRRLVAGGAVRGAAIVVVHELNPDGCRAGTRGNAHGLDLNRSFPGSREPETRFAVALIRALRPDVTIWFHQHEDVVRAWGPSVPTARRFAVLASFPYRTMRWPPGSATRWQNGAFPGTASFVVELPAGRLPPARVRAFAAAIREIAVEGVSR
jgi:murein peptide amidase A